MALVAQKLGIASSDGEGSKTFRKEDQRHTIINRTENIDLFQFYRM
jgi:hypothetical protein